MLNHKNWVVVFDIDDTIISERSYQLSGIKAVEKMISNVIKRNIKGQLIEAYKEGVDDLWDYAIMKFNISRSSKDSIIWTYRLHIPEINLEEGIKELLEKLINLKFKIFFISDGRVFTQRLKLKAVGLNHIRSLISEEYGYPKPDKKRFKVLNKKWPDHNFAYVADNPSKDFKAPKELGWYCIGADWVKDRVYKKNNKGIQPHVWAKEPFEVFEFISNHDNY